MTDDSTSRGTEDEESAEGERRPVDTEKIPRQDEELEHESERETAAEDESATDDEPTGDDPTHEQATIPGNPMAGIEAEPEGQDGPVDQAGVDDQTGPADQDESERGDDSESVVSPGTPGDETVAVEDDQPTSSPQDFVPDDVQKYERFKKMDGARYDRVNEFLRDRTYVTAREWAIARLCSDFRTETGIEMTKIGENLPRLVPFMNDTYTPQAVNQARHSFEEKVRKSGATFLYGAMSGFFTAEQLDDVMYEITEVAKFLLEVEGVDLSVEEELEAEDRILSVMREVREQSEQLRHEGATCPECGHEIGADGDD